jgi:hypothetical protein
VEAGVNRVAQVDPDGCGIATVAMLLDIAYDDAKRRLAVPYGRRVIVDSAIDAALLEAGRVVGRRYRYNPLTGKPREDWPPKPFAPRHYAIVHVAAGGHAVAMDADGRVLDPWDERRTSLTHPDYVAVDQVVGVWEVP